MHTLLSVIIFAFIGLIYPNYGRCIGNDKQGLNVEVEHLSERRRQRDIHSWSSETGISQLGPVVHHGWRQKKDEEGVNRNNQTFPPPVADTAIGTAKTLQCQLQCP